MKKLLQLSFVLFLICGTVASANAQTKKKKTTKKKDKEVNAEYFEEKTDFWKNTWWGIQTDQNLLSLGGNFFSIRALPSLSYKISERFSAGVITKVAYYWENVNRTRPQWGGLVNNYSTLDFSAGVMARFKISNNFFLHGEFENTWFKRPVGFEAINPTDPNTRYNVLKNTIAETYTYLGLGYTSGSSPGGWGYELSLNVDVTNSTNKVRYTENGLPIDIRIGFMKNF
jgi:hypothetical protein